MLEVKPRVAEGKTGNAEGLRQANIDMNLQRRRWWQIGPALFAAVTIYGLCAMLSPADESVLGGASSRRDANKLMREGSRVRSTEIVCRPSGDRLMVQFTDERPGMLALENLAAQRILKALADDVDNSHWVIDGTVTEFQGHNFILLDRINRSAAR